MKNNRIITIGRQFGSGGLQLGSLLGQELGIKVYDKEVLNEAARQHGVSTQLFMQADEKKPSPMRKVLQYTSGLITGGAVFSNYAGSFTPEDIYKVQTDTIRRIAEEEDCIFIGRTADYVLRDNPRLISVFLHSPFENRLHRVLERGNYSSESEAADAIRKADKSREEFYNYFSGRHWGHADNYHLTIDTSLISLDNIKDILKNIFTTI